MQYTLVVFSFFCFQICVAGSPFLYQFPLSGTSQHRAGTDIIIRPGAEIDHLTAGLFAKTIVQGSKSGRHSLEVIVSSDKSTVILHPKRAFVPDEEVFVRFIPSILGVHGSPIGNYVFSFGIQRVVDNTFCMEEAELRNDSSFPGFPAVRVARDGSMYPAPLIFSGGTIRNTYYRYGFLDTLGQPTMAVSIPKFLTHFRPLNDTLYSITHNLGIGSIHYLLNREYEVIDSVVAPEGMSLDFHDFQMLDNGNFLVLTENPYIVDMSALVPNGNPNAILRLNDIVELDKSSRLPVKIWRGIDHINILDWQHTTYGSSANLTASSIFLTHSNSIQQTAQNEWLMSVRNFDAVMLIDPIVGDVKWQIGGATANDFTFVNDPLNGFNNQHDATLLPDRRLILFDNGAYHTPPIARCVEYQLDENNMTATLIRSYPHPAGAFSIAGGSFSILPNGNRLISWGNLSQSPSPELIFASEADSTGHFVAHYQIDSSQVTPEDSAFIYLYRVYKQPIATDTTTLFVAPTITKPSFGLSPNPSKEGTLNIDVPQSTPIRIYNTFGQIVYSATSQNTPHIVSMPHQPSGIYWVCCTLAGKQYTQKWVLTR